MALISVSELLLVEIERAAVEKQYDLLNKVRIMEAKQERDEAVRNFDFLNWPTSASSPNSAKRGTAHRKLAKCKYVKLNA